MQSRQSPCRTPVPWRFTLPSVARCALVFLVCVASALLTACFETKLPDGVVATVNDEPIYLRSLLALQDSRTLGQAMQQQTVESLKKEYGAALGTLIIYTLAGQELERHNLAVSEVEVDAAIAVVEKDYEENGGLAKYLAEQSLDAEQWRAQVRNGLVMARLEREVLMPSLEIGLDQIRAYHASHTSAFSLPEILDVCLVSAMEKELVHKYCSAFPDKRHEAGKEPGLTVSCQQIASGSLPAPWHLEKDRINAGKCSQIRQQNTQQASQWQAVALIKRHKAQVMSLASAYPIVERKLQESARNELFAKWLEQSLAKSRIMVAAQLKESALAMPDGPAPDQTAVQEDENNDEYGSENNRSHNGQGNGQGNGQNNDQGRR